MQMLYTIELKVDFADQEKEAELEKTLIHCALRALATARLISDNSKATQVVVYGDNFMHGHKEISLYKDPLGEVSLEAIAEEQAEEPSAEMLEALR